MKLSPTQERAAMHGIPGPEFWSWLPVPIGPQPIPAWAKDVHINWNDGFANSPDVYLKVSEPIVKWPNQVWQFEEGEYYRSYSDDGRMRQYAAGPANILAEDADVWLTAPCAGYGGRHFELNMADGRKVILRGAWHTSPPQGWQGVTYHNTTSRYIDPKRPWFKQGLRFGVNIEEELLLRLIARFQPTVRMARVTYGGVTTIEPVREHWPCPKHWYNRGHGDES